MKNRSRNATRFALTGVALAAACLWGAQAWALGLGRLNVQSALGEALRAEIEVTNITPEELSSLRLRIASAEAYRAAGVEYNPVLPSAQVVLQQRSDGRQVLRVTSDRAVLEPFIDVILEANWATGRLVREYTLLFDPPGARLAQAPASAQTAPVISPAPAQATTPMAQAPALRPAPPPAPAAPVAAPSPSTARVPATVPAPAPTPTPVPAQAPVQSRAAPTGGVDEVVVRSGDSLSRIASRTLRPGVSLDQMLVSLYRGNPQAFMGENMNRLKAGAVLSVPKAEAAATVGAPEAREVIQAQSADFGAYRQRLAAGTTTVADSAPARQATGKVQANVDDRKAAATPMPDKLTLSQGGLKAAAPDAQASKETERKDATARLAELSRNVDELKKLQGVTVPAAPTGPAPAAAPAQPAPAAAPVVVAAAPAAPAMPTASASAPAAVAAVTASATARTTPAAAAPAAEQPGFLDSLLENPLALPGAAVLVALIAGLAVYRLRGRMRKPGGETSFLESRLQPDSFFGASGGQRIDTREGGAAAGTMSSMSYSLSQLDAIGDVDPVAEADVYLAYGRDLQAEEILKEAMRATPERMAIRTKLLEVYVKRRDVKGFELLATQLFSLTRGTGEDWEKAQELGRQIDPENPLYRTGGEPKLATGPGGKLIEPLGATTMPHTAKTEPPAFVPAAGATLDGGGLDVDLELDVVSNAPLPAPSVASSAHDGGLDFDIPLTPPPSPRVAALEAPAAQPPHVDAAEREMASLDFDLGDLPLPGPGSPAAPPAAGGALDFDDFGLGSNDAQAAPAMNSDPLSRKLELAEEFRQIGDLEGARDLLEEVIAKADGVLKSKAQGMLAGLG